MIKQKPMIEQKSDSSYRFIPFRKRDVVEMCLQDAKLTGQEANFRQLYYMLSSIFHFEFHQIIESLKDSYAPVDPDTDTRVVENQQLDMIIIKNVHHLLKINVTKSMESQSLF